jgi:putative transposase
VKNNCLAKSINDASWYQFRIWIEYFGQVFERVTVAVNPQYTSQECSSCGAIVKKTLSTRTHVCKCGCTLDRDENAARNILSRGLSTVGHTGTLRLRSGHRFRTRSEQRFGRIDLYSDWRNPVRSTLALRTKNPHALIAGECQIKFVTNS